VLRRRQTPLESDLVRLRRIETATFGQRRIGRAANVQMQDAGPGSLEMKNASNDERKAPGLN
jgi:hypothetical protein